MSRFDSEAYTRFLKQATPLFPFSPFSHRTSRAPIQPLPTTRSSPFPLLRIFAFPKFDSFLYLLFGCHCLSTNQRRIKFNPSPLTSPPSPSFIPSFLPPLFLPALWTCTGTGTAALAGAALDEGLGGGAAAGGRRGRGGRRSRSRRRGRGGGRGG